MNGSRSERSSAQEPVTLHRASRLIPVRGRPIENGAALVRGGVILAVGTHREIDSVCPAGAERIDHGDAALIPALVNAHTHLELSALKGLIESPQPGFGAWLGELFRLRAGMAPDTREKAFREAYRSLAGSGTAVFGDIVNGDETYSSMGAPGAMRVIFLEALGFDRKDFRSALTPAQANDLDRGVKRRSGVCAAAHACYSTSAEVIREAKEWSRERRRPFSIHVAEHLEEIEFLREGTGFCRNLLESLGKWKNDWTAPRATPVQYLDRLGVLDSRTVVVHAVHMTGPDWETIAARKCRVVFCPRSNANLCVGRADIARALNLRIPSALGTDSLAGNSDLDLFSEAAFLLNEYPEINPEDVLPMMTIAGAGALGLGSQFGSIERGKRSALLAVSIPQSVSLSRLAETVISQGEKGVYRWAGHPANN